MLPLLLINDLTSFLDYCRFSHNNEIPSSDIEKYMHRHRFSRQQFLLVEAVPKASFGLMGIIVESSRSKVTNSARAVSNTNSSSNVIVTGTFDILIFTLSFPFPLNRNNMYTLLKGFYKYFARKEEYYVLLLGLDKAGKTV